MERKRMLIIMGVVSVMLAFVVAGIVLAASSYPVDNFSVEYMDINATYDGVPVMSGTVGNTSGNIIGDERDVYVESLSGSGSANTLLQVLTDTGTLGHSQATGVYGYSILTWDGTDGDPTDVDESGLGGLDLTASGTYTGFAIYQISAAPIAPLVITVTTDASNVSSYTINTTEGDNIGYFAPYSQFKTVSGSGADFENVGSISLMIDGRGVNGADIDIGFFEAREVDMGDLPSTYSNTRHVHNGANHILMVNAADQVALGSAVDADLDGQEDSNASGDDNDTDADAGNDDDGVTRTGTPWTSDGLDGVDGGEVTISVTGSISACVSGWIDWNGNGNLDDPGTNLISGVLDAPDHVIDMAAVNPGETSFTFNVPDGTFDGTGNNRTFYARFRIVPDWDSDGDCSATDQSPLGLTGAAYNGEVEDYEWGFEPNAVTLSAIDAGPALAGWPALALVVAMVAGGAGLFVWKRRA